MSGVKPAEYLSENDRTEFYLSETKVLKILSGTGLLNLAASVLWIFPGAFRWGDLYCVGASGNNWQYCDGGTVGIWLDGISTSLIFFLAGVGFYYSAMLLENVMAIRNNAEKKETE